MKTLSFTLFTGVAFAALPVSAANLLLNFRSTSTNAAASGDVASPYLTLSPGHDSGTIPLTETTWNNFSTTAASSALLRGDGTAATGVSVTVGTEATAGSGAVSFTTTGTINTTSLYGNGGAASGQQALAGNSSSIYGNGNNSTNTAVARAGWLGGGTATAGNALGLRVDGLEAGNYRVFVMARNTNSNAATAAPMTIYSTTGASSSSFTFSPFLAAVESNTTYSTANSTAYNSFVAGENFVSFDVSVATGDSLFLASDGSSSGETRGFLNMVQIAAVPEPSALLLAAAGLIPLLRRRR